MVRPSRAHKQGPFVLRSRNALPTEIFVEIFSYSPSMDQTRISRASRRFHAIVEPLLYKRACLIDNTPTPSRQLFLRTILSRPGLAAYVQYLDIEWPGGPSADKLDPDSSLQDVSDLTLFTATARRTGLHRSPASQGAQAWLLLHLLPHLQSLELRLPEAPDDFGELLKQQASLPVSTLPAVLKSVRKIRIFYSGAATAPESLLGLLALPALRTLYVHVVGDTSHLPADAYPASSAVTDLRFGYGTISTGALARIVGAAPALTHLAYRDCDGAPGSFDAAVFGRALRGLRGTLRVLQLRFRWAIRRGNDEAHTECTLGSLREWGALRTLACPVTVLLGKGPKRAVARLADVVPVGVREVTLDVDECWTDREVGEQVVDMVQRREACALERLAGVTVRTREGEVDESVGAACDAAGVVLVAFRSYGC